MPGWVVLFVEFLLDESCDVLLDVELLEGLGGDVDSVLLHIFGHICVLDDCLSVCHFFVFVVRILVELDLLRVSIKCQI